MNRPKINSTILYNFSWVVFCSLTFITLLHHEPYSDEAQAWLITRDLPFSEIFTQLSVKGHPGLWYLILLPFSKMGFPYFTMLLIHWLISCISAGLFLFKAPINKLIKLLFVFSYYMIFEYTIEVRNYNLVILLLFLIGTFYQSRYENRFRYAFLLFLLFNCNLYAFGAAVGLTLIYLKDAYKREQWNQIKYPFLIMSLGAVFFLIQLWPSSHLAPDVTIKNIYIPRFDFNAFWTFLTSIQNAFIPIMTEYEELKVALFFCFVFILFLIFYITKPSILIFLSIASGWLFYIFITKLPGFWRHEGLLVVFLIFSMWITQFYETSENKLNNLIFKLIPIPALKNFLIGTMGLSLLVNVVFGMNTIRKELFYDFSGSKEMALFIRNNIPEETEIACYKSYNGSALIPYLPNVKWWFIDREEYGSYFVLDSIYQKYGDTLPESEIIQRTHSKYPKKAFLLVNEELTKPINSFYSAQLVHQNTNIIWAAENEKYFLYALTFR